MFTFIDAKMKEFNSNSEKEGDTKHLAEPPDSGTRIRIKSIVRLLLDYASFLCRSRGDIEGAIALYEAAVEVKNIINPQITNFILLSWILH